jgi:deoxycytidine triphosphate deaminase
MIKHHEIAARLNPERRGFSEDPFFIVPRPPTLSWPVEGEAKFDGAASIDLRLGTWFLTMRQTSISLLEIPESSELSHRIEKFAQDYTLAEGLGKEETEKRRSGMRKEMERSLIPRIPEGQLVRPSHIRFGADFILHPRSFVLGVTLEWLRLPCDLAGYVVGRSSWGRRGLVIATATGVHPGFTGCLTLELTNLGDVPIAIRPGMAIGQLFLHGIDAKNDRSVDQSGFACKRSPQLGQPKLDEIARKLTRARL